MLDNVLSNNSFFHNLGELVLGPIGNVYRMYKYINGASVEDAEKGVDALIKNGWKAFGAKLGMTTSPQEDIQYQRQLDFERDKYGLNVEGMRAAGVNPALMYGGGSMPSSQSMPTQSAGNLSDLLSMVMLPQQLKLINAQANDLNSGARLKDAQTDTQYTVAELNRISAAWMPQLKEAELGNLLETTRNIMSDTNMKVSQTDKITSEAAAQKVINQYLDRKQRYELDRLYSEIGNLDADTRAKKARAFYDEVVGNFASDNGFLMSSNDTLMLATYIASLFGLSKDDVETFIKNPFGWFKPTEKKVFASPAPAPNQGYKHLKN